jgi:NAD(P)-dependent dehydrogenase (short-subunit alcohol dehydrogenase family)
VTGATCIARAALPHLAESRGKAIFFSSIVIDDRPPCTGTAPYVVSKRALEALIEAWQAEHHEVSFTTIAMADSLSEFGVGHDPAVMGPIVARWAAQGFMYGRIMPAEAWRSRPSTCWRRRSTSAASHSPRPTPWTARPSRPERSRMR